MRKLQLFLHMLKAIANH